MKNKLLLVVLALGGLVLGILLNTVLTQSRSLPVPNTDLLQRGTALIGQEKPLIPFKLTDENGNTLDKQALKGHWTFMFFGYTQCPDICPVTLQVMGETLRLLQPEVDAGEVEGLFVSVDPARDDPEKLKTYTEYFHPHIMGATGDDAMLRQLTQSLGIIYAKVENKEHPERYLVDHSAAILLINPRAELAAVLSPPHEAKIMAEDFRTLKAYR